MWGDKTTPTAGPATQNLYQQKQASRANTASALGSIAKVAKGGISKMMKPKGGASDVMKATKTNPFGGTGGMGGE